MTAGPVNSDKPRRDTPVSARLRRRAATRVAGTTAVLFLAAMVSLGGIAMAITHAAMSRDVDDRIAAATAVMVDLARHGGRDRVIETLRRQNHAETNQLDFILYDRVGQTLVGRDDVPMPPPGWSDMTFEDPIEGGDPARTLTVTLPAGDRLTVAGNRRPQMIVKAAIGWLFLTSVVAVALLCAMMGWLLARYLDRRLAPIAATAVAVMEGDMTRRMPVAQDGDEFDIATASLNVMLDRIAGLMANLHQVSSDLAHDLRTPLTRIRTRLERATEEDVAGRDAAIRHAIDQLDDVVTMFNAILRIAEIESAQRLDSAPVVLESLALDVVGIMMEVFEEAGIVLRFRADQDCLVMADSAQIAAAFINLLENVLRHAGAGCRADVSVRHVGDEIALTVQDTGPGVGAEDLDRMFDRFVRLDGARTMPGNGLGLSLVKAIVNAHDARISAVSDGNGLAITIFFPALERTARG